MADDTYDDDSTGTENDGPNWRRKLEAEAREGRQAKEQLAQMQRDLAFAKAGIDLSDPKMGYFIRGYDGELDADAIKTAATDAGFLGNQAAAPDPAADLAGINAMRQATSGGVTVDGGSGTEAGLREELSRIYESEGKEALLDRLESLGISVTTRQ